MRKFDCVCLPLIKQRNIDNVIQALHRAKYLRISPAAIVLEITESLLLDDRNDVKNVLQGCQSAGMQVALDDFGTGYSAMAYLKKFNIDYLKIDRSSVTWKLTPATEP